MKKNDKYLIVTLLGITFLILGIIYLILNNNRNLTKIESGIKDMGIIVQKTAYIPIKFISDKIIDFSNMYGVYKNFKEQNKKLEQYELLNASLTEKNKIIEELEGLLELKNNLSDYSIINATVVNRNIGYFYDNITIDKGENDGIKKDMAVITNKGLIGKIKYVTNNTSTVQLLTTVNEEFQISVTVEQDDKSIHGLLSSFDNNQFVISGISDVVELKQGSKVITTGFGNLFPSGILVGYVDKSFNDRFDLERKVYINPSISFDSIRYVSILKRENVWLLFHF